MMDRDSVLDSVDISDVVGSYVKLIRRGGEYVARCVSGSHDDKTPSMSVVPAKDGKKGFVHCFSCEFHEDAIGFVMHMDGVDFAEACRRLGRNKYERVIVMEAAPDTNKNKEYITLTPPENSRPVFTITSEDNDGTKIKFDPSQVFDIKNLDGAIIGHEARYDIPGKGKEHRIFSYGYLDGQGESSARWRIRAFPFPRPLFGLQELTAKPAAQVLLTEGPKKAAAAGKLIPAMASLSWLGGAQGWRKMDWSPLVGRSVVIWPDADEVGIKAAEGIASLLTDPAGRGCAVKIIYPDDHAGGWDAADAVDEGWTMATTLAWAKEHARITVPPVTVPPVTVPPAAEQEAPQGDNYSGAKVIPVPERKSPPVPVEAPARPALRIVGGTALVRVPAPNDDDIVLPYAMSEDALADFFVRIYGQDWRYIAEWNYWYLWDGSRWMRDVEGRSGYVFVEITRKALLWPEAQSLTADGKRKINSRRYAGAARDIAAWYPEIRARSDQWDKDPFLLGVPAGVIDLKTGNISPNSKVFYITKQASVDPSDDDHPVWTNFLNRITDGSTDLMSYLQRYAGYCLTGDTSAQAFSFLYGSGQNGKGVFLGAIKNIMGDYAQSIDDDTLMAADGNRHTQELAVLVGCRLAVVDETDASKRWNEGRIKRLTGGMPIVAHRMRQDNFEFMPVFKMWIAGNHRPALRGVGKAMARRMHLVPFTVEIPDSERDERLGEKLRAEYPAILRWMIEGCMDWQKNGLQPPDVIVKATQDYLEAEDILGAWIDACTCNGTADGRVLFESYKSWAEANGHPVWSRRAWANAMLDRGITSYKSSGLVIYRIGLVQPAIADHGDDGKLW